ncbi:MAG TPA: tRNA (adenosine(37)-N6)-threonylcarbamoyltransferase complex ATPase subunit type 1 TsaE [Candidatus Moranbacteria bacterium]|nr:tRNA (adenosine(37)-N6)-threonylcarbamoyltransferase complex ATPase subunit type 1 TsaE [Candidatus Moranbacteria bacterium]
MQKITYITENSKQTQKLGETLAKELKGGEIICLVGELGGGKTTFTQGFLKGLKVKGPYTSPTFLVIKNYKKEISISKSQIPNKSQNPKSKTLPTGRQVQNIYHIDTYRINAQDIINLGWEEMVADKKNIIIIEWADRIKKIIPKNSLWIEFSWVDEKKRKITLKD